MTNTDYEHQLPVLVGDIYRNWRETIDAVAKIHNMTKTEWHILGKLECRGPELLQHELSELIGIDNAQLSRALNGLEDKKYISRRVDKKNRRIRHIRLVNPNADYIKKMIKVNTEINDVILSNLTSSQQEQLIKLLSKVSKITKDIKIKA